MATMNSSGPKKPQTLTKMKSDSELLANDNIGYNPQRKILLADHNHNLLPTTAADAEVDSGVERVTLPQRYTLPLNERTNAGDGGREADLDAAIRWLRQEVLQMKSQDRLLEQKFKVLSSTISEIKESHYTSRTIDLGSSCHSLDFWAETSMSSSGGWSPMSERDIIMDFQSDSVSCSPMVDRDIMAEFRGQASSPAAPRRSPLWVKSGNKEEFV